MLFGLDEIGFHFRSTRRRHLDIHMYDGGVFADVLGLNRARPLSAGGHTGKKAKQSPADKFGHGGIVLHLPRGKVRDFAVLHPSLYRPGQAVHQPGDPGKALPCGGWPVLDYLFASGENRAKNFSNKVKTLCA